MIRVRRHKRQTASGKVVTVRAHERDGGEQERPVPAWVQPAYVGDLTAPGTGIFDDDPEYQRLKELRESGYDGCVDQDGNPVTEDWWDDAGDADAVTPEGNLLIVRDSDYFTVPGE